jgi:hypothetical protein
MSGEDPGHDCTASEFQAWYDDLSELLMEYDQRVCDGTGCDLGARSMQIDLYGQQVKRLLDELTLLAEYKASTEAARRRSQDPKFMAELRARMEERDRERYRELTRLGEEIDGTP